MEDPKDALEEGMANTLPGERIGKPGVDSSWALGVLTNWCSSELLAPKQSHIWPIKVHLLVKGTNCNLLTLPPTHSLELSDKIEDTQLNLNFR